MEPERIVVIGVGSELHGDDAVGIIITRRVVEMGPLPDNVTVLEGHTGGLDLLFDIEDADRAILVDAVDFGGQPGELAVFDAEDADIHLTQRVASLHHVSLADVLELGRATGLEARITIVGLQPGSTAFGLGLSEPVAAQVDRVARVVRGLIDEGEPSARQGRSSPDRVES
jgi:hydrogenase maturation protease